MKKILTIAVVIGIMSQSLSARDEYDRTFDSIYVAQKIYYSLDAELNKVFTKLKGKLSKKGKKILNKSEMKWVEDRDHKCAFPETNSVNIECAVSETKDRLHFLEDRVRECEELGCKEDKL
jgi:uncharacterized protein YecT (DUF1311 family)